MASSYTGTNQRVIAYLAKHPGATVSEARGHRFTPEHGSVQRGNTVEVYRGADASRVIARVAAEDQARRDAAAAKGEAPPPWRRVVVTTFEKGGGHKSHGANPGHKKGMTAKYVADNLARERTFRQGMRDAIGGDSPRGRGIPALERVQITIEG